MKLVWVDESGPCIGCTLTAWKVEAGQEERTDWPWIHWHDICYMRFVVKPAPAKTREPA